MLEQQIYSIESANINQETLVAMKNAGKAMKEIHGKMTMEDVDTTMYVCCLLSIHPSPLLFHPHSLPNRPPPVFISTFLRAGKNKQSLIAAIRCREQLREQHELTQEIGNAITSMPITEPIDEDELEADLAAMEQEKLDDQMLSTGTTVPVADRIDRQHAAANGAGELLLSFS